MNKREFMQFVQTMRIRNLPFQWERLDAVRHHATTETLKHYLMKCMTSRILHRACHHHFTEFEFPNKAEADIYDATDNIVIEFETRKSAEKANLKYLQYKGYARDCIVLYCEDYSDDPREMEVQLMRKLGH